MPDCIGSADANVLLRLLLNDVPAQHSAALALVARGELRVSDVAVAETVFVLGRHYELSRRQLHGAMRRLLLQPQIVASGKALAALETYLEHPKLSFEDCLLVEHARHDAAQPLWTFDRKLANQTSARLVADHHSS
ncbi:MAG: PIN domain-containing protein [Arachnia sp.]